MSKKWRIILLIVLFLIALSTRLYFIHLYQENYFISLDGKTYANMADNFLKGNGMVTTIRDRDYVVGPVYPLFLAISFLLFGINNFSAVVFLQAIISALTAIIGYKIGEELFGSRYAWIPFTLFVLYPQFAFWNLYILTETTYIFMVTLFLYAGILYANNVKGKASYAYTKTRTDLNITTLHSLTFKKEPKAYALFLGGILGLANLDRPILLLSFPVLLIWMWLINHWKIKKTLKDFLLVVLMSVIVMSPWWIRNYVRYHEFIAATNYGSYELYAGNNSHTITDSFYKSNQPSYDPVLKAQIDQLPVDQQEKEYSRLAKSYILAHPWAFVERTMAKEVNLFWQPISDWESKSYQFKGYIWDKWYLILGLIGAIMSLIRFKKYSLPLLITVYYSLVVSAITVVSGGRYRVPIMPAVILLGSVAIVYALKGIGRLSSKLNS